MSTDCLRTPVANEVRQASEYCADDLAEAQQVLEGSSLCNGLTGDQVRKIAQVVQWRSIASGEVLCRQNQPGDSMFIVASGRCRVSVASAGESRLLGYLVRGEHAGEMALLADGRRAATVSAATDVRVLELAQSQFDVLLETIPRLATNLSRTLGARLKWQSQGPSVRRGARVVAIVHPTSGSRVLVDPLARALTNCGERMGVLTDRPTDLQETTDYSMQSVATADGDSPAYAIRTKVAQLEEKARLLWDIELRTCTRMIADLSMADQIWWMVPTYAAGHCFAALRQLLLRASHLAARIHVVWLLPPGERFAPLVPEDLAVSTLNFKVDLAEITTWHVQHGSASLSRLVRQVRGTRVGLALGGGGARGMAHFGALAAFRDAGIHFDHVAGTSSGALVGLAFSAGLDPDYATQQFHRALTPSFWFNLLPKSKHWYMLSMFRLGRWDGKLRPYFGQARLEQLPIPLSTVAVDLITGRQVVRDRGDAIHAVLESINLPGIARPILKHGQAMIDGGVFNNVPVDVLAERGLGSMVGIDVASRLKHVFAGNTPATPRHQMRKSGLFDSLVRLNEIQAYELTQQRTRAADLMISVDASAFAFADFTAAPQLAAAGELAAERMIPAIKAMFAEQGI